MTTKSIINTYFHKFSVRLRNQCTRREIISKVNTSFRKQSYIQKFMTVKSRGQNWLHICLIAAFPYINDYLCYYKRYRLLLNKQFKLSNPEQVCKTRWRYAYANYMCVILCLLIQEKYVELPASFRIRYYISIIWEISLKKRILKSLRWWKKMTSRQRFTNTQMQISISDQILLTLLLHA